MSTIRVLVCDDQSLVRGALAALLDLEPDLQVVGEAGDGREAVAQTLALRPDVVLMDIDMPELDGFGAAEAIRAARVRSRVVFVTTFGRPGYLRRGLDAGGVGFVVKDTPARELAEAVRRVHAGLRVIDPILAADTVTVGVSPLTERETEVLRLARDGGSITEIAGSVHLSEGTVRNHLSAAIGKCDARNRADAARIADENGWL